jgi:CheY-like chemotaxis protein
MMPLMNGFELLQNIRSFQPAATIPGSSNQKNDKNLPSI